MLNERLRKLRKALDLTQREFAEGLGMKQNTIATFESGRNAPSDQTIRSICREYSVDEEWLRTGTGDMFCSDSGAELDSLVVRYNLNQDARTMIEKFVKLKPDLRAGVIAYCRSLVEVFGEEDEPETPKINVSAAEAAYEKGLSSARKTG